MDINGFLDEYALSQAARFHMPGHKGINGFARDITDGIPGADEPLAPYGIIKAAQEKAAGVFGASRTWLCTQGSTGCLHAMLLSLPQNTVLLLERCCHKSAISGAVMAGYETYLEDMRTPELLQAALKKHPETTAVLVTRPDYFGRCVNIRAFAGICKDRLLLVDEAHGAHYVFSGALPESCAGYADMWCQSAHKTLTALTPGAYLHMGSGNKPGMSSGERLDAAFAMVHTSSPSYPILASLESAFENPGDWDAQCERAKNVRGRLKDAGWDTLENEDVTRIVIDAQSCGGYELYEHLAQNGVVCEMADPRYVCLITSPNDPGLWYDALIKALASRHKSWYGCIRTKYIDIYSALAGIKPQRQMMLRDAALAVAEPVPLEKAEGRTAARSIGVYPPGAAVCAPGEVITRDIIEILTQAARSGGALFGAPPLCVREDIAK